jgi:hypothetical protein
MSAGARSRFEKWRARENAHISRGDVERSSRRFRIEKWSAADRQLLQNG